MVDICAPNPVLPVALCVLAQGGLPCPPDPLRVRRGRDVGGCSLKLLLGGSSPERRLQLKPPVKVLVSWDARASVHLGPE